MQQLLVDGIDIYIDGPEDDEHAETIVMIHGWPDTYRLWERQVAELKHRYRCVRFTLPGFDVRKQRRSYTLDATMRILLHVVNSVNRQQPVILMAHDWGCVFGYEFYMRNRTLVCCCRFGFFAQYQAIQPLLDVCYFIAVGAHDFDTIG